MLNPKMGRAKIFSAIKYCDRVRLDELLATKQCSPNTRSGWNTPALVKAVRNWSFKRKRRDAMNGKILRMLLRHGADVDAKDSSGRTASMWAVYYGLLDCLKKLAESGADLSLTDRFGYSPYAISVLKKRKKCIKFLLSRQQSCEDLHKTGVDTSAVADFLRAIKNGDIDGVEKLIESKRCLINTHTAKGIPVVSYCIKKICSSLSGGDTTAGSVNCNILDILLKNGADVDLKDIDGWTTAMRAARFGYIRCLESLYNVKADFSLTNKFGNNALMLAVQNGHLECVKFLIQHTPDINHSNRKRFTAIMLAETCSKSNMELARMLLQAGCSTELKDRHGRTVLHMAAAKVNSMDVSHHDRVKLYVESGADVNVATKDGKTALMLVTERVNIDTMKVLLDHGAHVDDSDGKGTTVLMYAVTSESKTAVNLLLAHGASVNISGLNKLSPFGQAFKYYEEELPWVFNFPWQDTLQQESHRYQMVIQLLDAGADMSRSREDQMKLITALINRDCSILQKMILNGCPPYSIPPFNISRVRSPLAFARNFGYPEIARYLLANRLLTTNDLRDVGLTNDRRTYKYFAGDEKCREIELSLSSRPYSLRTLSFVAVSATLYDEASLYDDVSEGESEGERGDHDNDGVVDDFDDSSNGSDDTGECSGENDNDDGSDPFKSTRPDITRECEEQACRRYASSTMYLGSTRHRHPPDRTNDNICESSSSRTKHNRPCQPGSSNRIKNDGSCERGLFSRRKNDNPRKARSLNELDTSFETSHKKRRLMSFKSSTLPRLQPLTRKEKVGQLPLPQSLKDALLFQLPTARVDPSLWNDLCLDRI